MPFLHVRAGAIAVAMLASIGPFVSREAAAQDTCSNRGQLDTLYCDANNDLVADLPAANRQRDPSTMIFAYTPVEDPAVYANIFKPSRSLQRVRTRVCGDTIFWPSSKPIRRSKNWPI